MSIDINSIIDSLGGPEDPKIKTTDLEIINNLLISCDSSLFVTIIEAICNEELNFSDFKLDYIDLAMSIQNLLDNQIQINEKIAAREKMDKIDFHEDLENVYYKNENANDFKNDIVYNSAVLKSSNSEDNIIKKNVASNINSPSNNLNDNDIITAYNDILITSDYESVYLTDEDIVYANTYGISIEELKKMKSLYNYLNQSNK